MEPSAERRLNAALVAASLVAIVLGGFAFVAGMSLGADGSDRAGIDCDEWRFDPEAWKRDREPTAYALVECRTLIGMGRAEAATLFGKRGPGDDRRWKFDAGAANDYMGPGDANYLYVRFDRGDRVERARLLYGGERAAAD